MKRVKRIEPNLYNTYQHVYGLAHAIKVRAPTKCWGQEMPEQRVPNNIFKHILPNVFSK